MDPSTGKADGSKQHESRPIRAPSPPPAYRGVVKEACAPVASSTVMRSCVSLIHVAESDAPKASSVIGAGFTAGVGGSVGNGAGGATVHSSVLRSSLAVRLPRGGLPPRSVLVLKVIVRVSPAL